METVLQDAKRAVLLGHVHPDGDCIGSCLATFNYIRARYEDRRVDVCLGPASEELAFLSGYDSIHYEIPEEKEYDLCIYLDSSDKERLGGFGVLLDGTKQGICIGHHITNIRYAMEDVAEPSAGSTCEVLFGQMDERWVDKSIVECTCTGIVHDIGVFKFSNILAKTVTITGKMMERGIDFGRIINESFFQENYPQIQILGRALLESIALLDKGCIFSVVSKKDMEFFGVENKGLDGVMDRLRVIERVERAIFLYEIDNYVCEASLYSNTQMDVSKIVSYFGGDDRVRTVGCVISGSIYDMTNNLSEHIEGQLAQTGENYVQRRN